MTNKTEPTTQPITPPVPGPDYSAIEKAAERVINGPQPSAEGTGLTASAELTRPEEEPHEDEPKHEPKLEPKLTAKRFLSILVGEFRRLSQISGHDAANIAELLYTNNGGHCPAPEGDEK